MLLKGVNLGGKKFKQRGIILRFENEFIVLKNRYSQVSNDGKFISLQEINQINMVNQKKQTTLLLTSIVASLSILGVITILVSFAGFGGAGISTTEFYTPIIVSTFILGFLPYLVVNSGMDRIENLQTNWKIEQINMP